MRAWGLEQIRNTPIYTVLHPTLKKLDWPQDWPSLADYQRLLDGLPQPVVTASGKPLHVVAQATEKPLDWQHGYEPRIYLHGELQTRLESWHDCFNWLTWITLPLSKAALNARQYALLEARQMMGEAAGPRSAKQDTLTQFDESGVIVLSAELELTQLLRDFRWKSLFWEQRDEVRTNMRCFLFGHGLMERALNPYRGLTGKGIVLPVTKEFLDRPLADQLMQVDQMLAQRITDTSQFLSPLDLAPVPILGFPGFTADNERAEYYEDERYFRPGRSLRVK